MNLRYAALIVAVLFLTSAARAADHRVEPLDEGPPTDEISKAIAGQLSPTGFQIIRGTSRTVCQIWLCKELDVLADFKASSSVLYPFKPGQLIGVVRYKSKSGDYRDQDIGRGVYTLRYSQQPVDGNHVGTSITRDFLLLVRADVDESAEPLDYEKLAQQSAEAAESTHPALLSMQRIKEGQKPLSMRHDEERDWWIVSFVANVNAGKKSQALPVSLVIVGHADE